MQNHNLIGYCRFDDILPLRECAQKKLLPENPKAVIAVLLPYNVGEYPDRNVSRYAIIDDYHRAGADILTKLASQLEAAFPDEKSAVFIDNSPIREVFAAYRCGLGSIGKNGLLIHESFGSQVFIGTIITTLELNPPVKSKPETCLDCGACIAACPTKAIKAGASLDKSLCRSAITQKKRGLTDWEASQIKMGGLAWGCDICQDACPVNRHAPRSMIGAFYENILPVVTRENISDAIADKPYNWRGEDVILRNLELIINIT